MSSPKPTILIIHGSGLTPQFYTPLTTHLTTLSYPTLCPLLPTCSPTATATTDLLDDALSIRSTLTRLIEYESKSVILLMHSYGGLPGSEAVPESLTATSRQKLSLSGGVEHLIYISAFMLPAGESCLSVFGSIQGVTDSEGFYTHTDPRTTMFEDVDDDREADVWMGRLVKHPVAIQTRRTTRAAWGYVGSTYVVLTEDLSVPPAVQERFAEGMGARVVRFKGGHLATLTRAGELGGLVDGIVQGSA